MVIEKSPRAADMKIAILTTDNRGQFKEFDKPKPWFGPAPEALLSGFAELGDIEVHVISCIRRPVQSPPKLADNIYFHSLHVPQWGWMRTGYLGCLRAVRRQLRAIQPDLVHGQGSEFGEALCAAFSGYPNVITLLGIMREMARILRARPGSFYWLAARLESLALRRTRGVLTHSHWVDDRVRPRCRQTWLVPNAVSKIFLETPPPAQPPGPPPVLLNVGSVCAYKRQNELLDIVEELHREGLEFRLEFFGAAGRGDAYGAAFLDRVNGAPWMRWHGHRPPAELIAAYDRAHALVHGSRVETFGLVVAEALARNLKVFAFSVGGLRDVGAGVEGAELFTDGDWTGLKAAVRRWLHAGAPRPATAAATIRERYHPAVIARQHVDVYRKVLSREPLA